MKTFIIKENEAGQRFDKYLKKLLKEAPSSFVYKMLRKKNIVLNGKKADGSEKLNARDEVKLFLADETYDKFAGAEVKESFPTTALDIVYEDEDILIINKPAGMLSQKAQPSDISANEYIIGYLLQSRALKETDLRTFRPSVCNRLDRNTSGLLTAGKTLKGLQDLSETLKKRTVKKYYLCLVAGCIRAPQHLKGYLMKDERQNRVFISKEKTADALCIETKKKQRSTRGAKLHQMAFANLGRNKKKTVLVVVSLALSVTLFNALCAFVGGFSMEKYVSSMTCADFIVSTPDYFRYNPADEFITPEQIEEIAANTKASLSGTGYAVRKPAYLWMTEDALRQDYARYESAEQLDSHMSRMEHRGNMVMGDTRIEALDNSLFDKLQVFDGDISPMLEPNNNAIAIAVSLDDYGNLPNPEHYPKVGDTITATYADDVKYIDSRTGELCTEDTPEEYLQEKLYGARDVEYTVCALVELPYSMSYRYGGIGYETVLSVDTAQRDSGDAAIPMLYLFDTADETDEAEAEQYLSKLTAGEFSPLMYESKATARSEFAQFRQMFLLIGGILCAIIGLVGLLNFFNAMMTGILSRRREFAVLQAVGMTNRQLKTMLIYEGLFYAMSSVAVAFILSLVVGPLAGKMLGSMFWFFEYQFTILPVLLTIPVFLLLGWLIPCMMYDNAAKCSVVEQLRDAQ